MGAFFVLYEKLDDFLKYRITIYYNKLRHIALSSAIIERKEQGIMAIRILLSRKLGELRWTQADLARKTGIRPNTINEMYHELCERVNLDHLDLICEALDCDLSEIVVREENGIKETADKHRSG